VTSQDVAAHRDASIVGTAQPLAAPALGCASPKVPPAPRLKVAAVMDTWIVSGPGRQLVALAQGLREHGVELRVVMFQRRGREPSPFIAYCRDHGIEPVVLDETGPLDPGLPGRLAGALRELKPDLVQTHGYRPTALVATMRLARPPWRWLAFFHGETNENWKVRAYNRLDRRLMPFADRVVLVSESHRNRFARVADRLRVIPNASISLPARGSPVEIAPFRRPGTPLIVTLARLSPEKGVDILVESAALLHQKGREVSVVVAGDGPERAAIEALIARHGLEEQVHLLGQVENVESLYRQADLVVLPSRSEGFPNVLMEALRADVPVVATAVASVPEILSDPDSGVVVPPGRADLLADGIDQALASGRTPSARLARRRASATFSLERRVAGHLALYDELLPGRLAATAKAHPLATAAGRKLRIEMVLPSLARGGMERMVVALARGMAARGHQVGITCLEESGPLAGGLSEAGVAMHLVPCPGVLANFEAARQLRDHFAALGPDIVHAHSGVWGKSVRAARAAGVPVVIHTAHGFVHGERWRDDVVRFLASLSTDAVLAVSDHLADYLARHVRIARRKLSIGLNGIDTDRFRPGPRSGILRERFGIASDVQLVGCVARLDPVKNLPGLLDAVARLRPDMPGLALVLVGDGPLESELRQRAADLGIADHVIFAGALGDTASAYRDLDLFVLPSHAEGTSISLLEALASGTPVVATSVGGTPKILADGPCGRLVPPGDPAALAAAIREAFAEPEQTRHLAETGRRVVEAKFSLDAMLDQHEALYRSLVLSGRGRA
jgi:glycosyltransferase involved in cell wall biosynthesis